MADWTSGLIEAHKAARVTGWLGETRLVADLSWGLVDTLVLHARTPVGDVIVKTAGPTNRHIAREIAAHRSVTAPLVSAGRTSRLLHADGAMNLLVLEYQPGELVQGSGLESSLDVHRQAGEMLRMLHSATPSRIDSDYVSNIAGRASR